MAHCDVSEEYYQSDPYSNGLSLHRLMTIVSAVCAGVTVLICLFPLQQHLRHYICPDQQKHLARIAILPAVFAIFHVFGVVFYEAARFLEPFPGLFEAISICSLFELYVSYVCPGLPDDAATRFRHIASIGRYATKSNGAQIVRRNYMLLYQLPYVTMICLIATEITSAIHCELSTEYKRSQKIIRVIGTGSTIIALIQIIIFHIYTRQQMQGMRAIRKLTAIKILALVVIVMNLVFGFFKPSITEKWHHASYFDTIVGFPNALICIEMVVFAIVWIFLFGSSSVVQSDTGASSAVGKISALKALGQIISLSDIWSNTMIAFMGKSEERDSDSEYKMETVVVKNEVGRV